MIDINTIRDSDRRWALIVAKRDETIISMHSEILDLRERLGQAERFILSDFMWCSKCKHYTEDDGKNPWVVCEYCGTKQDGGE